MCDIEVDFVNGQSYKGLLSRNIGDNRSVPNRHLKHFQLIVIFNAKCFGVVNV